ncbi:DUF1223 domain-containing protein [Nitratireductor sp. GISD-1A_MAKvit]|uniref:DUF1223 domain-containing protein n=1 Tax=Nitratireductor sp. GISD-1A_MAKvit TaxID=3234198 RepID=UPI003467E0CD
MFRLTTHSQCLAVVLFLFAPWGSAGAQEATHPIGVVELFTSQGCSSCPPADAILSELAERDDIISLAYHVDYWDYLGWRDRLGSAENTARQKGYAHTLQNTTVYTPQVIVNGRHGMNGGDRDRIGAHLEHMAGTPEGLQVGVALEDRGDTLLIKVGSGPEHHSDEHLNAHLVFVDYAPRSMVEIRSGENRGRTVEYRNAVNRIRTIGMWDGRAKSFEMPKGRSGAARQWLRLASSTGRPRRETRRHSGRGCSGARGSVAARKVGSESGSQKKNRC